MAEWFTKSFIPDISKDVAKGGVVTKEKLISHTYMPNLTTLYKKILNLPCPTILSDQTESNPTGSNAANGVIGSISQQYKGKKANFKSTQTVRSL